MDSGSSRKSAESSLDLTLASFDAMYSDGTLQLLGTGSSRESAESSLDLTLASNNAMYSDRTAIILGSGSLRESAESSLDLRFISNNAMWSDRTLQLQIMPNTTVTRTNHTDSLTDLAQTTSGKRRRPNQDHNVHEAVHGIDNQSSTDNAKTRVKNIPINTACLAAKSPFFHKLFSHGMSESSNQLITLQIHESEEAAFMEMLKFMHTDTLPSTTQSTLIGIFIAAKKYEVESCMEHCERLLGKPMTYESAVLYMSIPSTIIMDDRARSLTDEATKILVAPFTDINKFEKELLNLPLAAIKAVLSHDDLHVDSEDTIYDFVMKWAHSHYAKHCELQEILNTHLLGLIRFQYLSCDKLKELLSCPYIDHKRSAELIYEALSVETPYRQLSLVSSNKARAYNLRPVKVIISDTPEKECVVYLNLKHEECTRLLINDQIHSRDFQYGGKAFYLVASRVADDRMGSAFGMYLGMRETGSVVDYEFSAGSKPCGGFLSLGKSENVCFSKATGIGKPIILGAPWHAFADSDSPCCIKGVVHIRAIIKFKEVVPVID